MKKGLVLLILAVLSAGCLSPSGNADYEEPAPSGTLQIFSWNDCRGFFVSDIYPAGNNPGTPPGGWGQANGFSRVGLFGWECTRIHWDNLERGPIRLLLELHDNMVVPENCRTDAKTEMWSLASFWTDDEGVAALAATLDLPVRQDLIKREIGPAGDESWQWGDSSLQVTSAQEGSVLLPDARLFWEADGVHVLDLDQTATGGSSNGASVGTFAAPMLLAEGPQPKVMPSNQYTGTSIHGAEGGLCA